MFNLSGLLFDGFLDLGLESSQLRTLKLLFDVGFKTFGVRLVNLFKGLALKPVSLLFGVNVLLGLKFCESYLVEDSVCLAVVL